MAAGPSIGPHSATPNRAAHIGHPLRQHRTRETIIRWVLHLFFVTLLACHADRHGHEGYAASLRSACEDAQILALVNDPATTADVLHDLGVYSRGAHALVDARDNGTVFTTVVEIDAVPWVGPASLAALYAAVDGAECSSDTAMDCDERAVVDLLDDPELDADALRELGVYSRGADALLDARAEGAALDSYEAIDAISYVGPSSMSALRVWGELQCEAQPEARAVFSPQSYAQSHLSEVQLLLDEATVSLDIAMYSFSDEGMYQAVERATARGVSVRVIFETAREDRKDVEGSRSERLEAMGAEVRWVNKIMHEKFVLVDGPRDTLDQLDHAVFAGGSANWSYSAATRYDENTAIVRHDDKLILAFQQEFNHMWTHSRPVVSNESIPHVPVTFEISPSMIEAAPGTEVIFTSANFNVYFSNTYGWTFSAPAGVHTVADRIADEISQATSSIHIASGHMRSKQIADALLAKHAESPEVEILVYLDGQEWISAWWENEQNEDLAECLEEATTDIQRARCEEVGRYFSKALADAGIDVRFDYYAFRWHYTYAEQMHHKYIILDGERVLTGSYNFSSNAEVDSFENVVLFDASNYPELVDAFIDNHAELWETGQGSYEPLLDEIVTGTAPTFPIVWSPMSLNWSEVNALKAAVRTACPAVDSEAYRDDPSAYQACERP